MLTWEDFYESMEPRPRKLKTLDDYHEDIRRFKESKRKQVR